MDNDKYQAISCSEYDIYEIAIMHGKCLQLSWLDEQGQLQEKYLKPLNLHIRDSAEFLRVETTAGEQMDIRLDKIQQAK